MKRLLLPVTAIAAMLSLAACGGAAKDTGTTLPATTPTITASSPAATALPPGPSPSSTSLVPEFSVDGTGAYEIGDKLTDLQTTPGLANVTTGAQPCPQDTTAQGTGAWKDVEFSFGPDGALYLAINRSVSIPTPSGAWLGTTLAQLKKIYASIETEPLTAGTRKAFLVTTVSGGGILFELTPQGTVQEMVAGVGTYLKSSFQSGTSFC